VRIVSPPSSCLSLKFRQLATTRPPSPIDPCPLLPAADRPEGGVLPAGRRAARRCRFGKGSLPASSMAVKWLLLRLLDMLFDPAGDLWIVHRHRRVLIILEDRQALLLHRLDHLFHCLVPQFLLLLGALRRLHARLVGFRDALNLHGSHR